MFTKAPVRTQREKRAIGRNKGAGSNRIIIRKMFDAERKELTESNCVDKLSSVNIL